MKISSVTLCGFRCFAEQPTTIRLSDGITTLIGANGSGKTAFLEALTRVFGVTRDQRTVRRNDFYVAPEEVSEAKSSQELSIDIYLSFPELEEDEESGYKVADCFRHMTLTEVGGAPICRVRLEAIWTEDGTVDGNIDQKLWWVTTDDETPDDEHKKPLEGFERGLIQVHYVPATRDASSQLTYATNAMAGRLLRAIAWSEETRQTVQDASQRVYESFGKELAVQEINRALRNRWKDLHDVAVDAEPEFQIISRQFDEVIRRFSVTFRPTETGGERAFEALSDGQKSLFYFSLTSAVFDIERELVEAKHRNGAASSLAPEGTREGDTADKTEGTPNEDKTAHIHKGFQSELLQTPALTVFAIEEPENHLAPYFLSRIVNQIRSIVKTPSGQAVIASHSPAILGRIDPSEVRHFRLDHQSRTAITHELRLPREEKEVIKYVREAIIAYPELYFARFVVLGEGASEQIVLPRLALTLGLDVDRSFVAVTPLGGRHVNHFWKLLNDLQIPHVTLLDLDLGRKGAGWGRIQYACKQLLAVGLDRNQLLSVPDANGNPVVLSDDDLEKLGTDGTHDYAYLKIWTDKLEKFGVFFCAPLDLDMTMLSSFPPAYQSIAPSGGGPRIPSEESPNYQKMIESAAKKVLGEDSLDPSAYPTEVQRLLPWYRYLFLDKGKPSTHLLALSQLSDEELAADGPPVLKRMLQYVDKNLRLDQTE